MSKPVVFVLLLVFAILTASVFGALHNQLSYSIGSTYFHEFKFLQFGFSEGLHTRLGASLVGVQASWWMGLLVGVPAFLVGLATIRSPGRYLAGGIAAIGAVIFVTMVFSMAGLVLGMIAPGYADQLPVPRGITDRDSFLRAALMHEASYYGGVVGIFVAVWTIWQAKKAESRAQNRETRE